MAKNDPRKIASLALTEIAHGRAGGSLMCFQFLFSRKLNFQEWTKKCVLICTILVCLTCVEASAVLWESDTGATVEADLIGCNRKVALLEGQDGKRFAIAVNRLSAKNKAYLSEMLPWSSFRGIAWGENIKNVTGMKLFWDAAERRDRGLVDGLVAYTRKGGTFEMGGAKIDYCLYYFYKGRFNSAYAALRGDQNVQRLIQSLNTSYGPATEINDALVWHKSEFAYVKLYVGSALTEFHMVGYVVQRERNKDNPEPRQANPPPAQPQEPKRRNAASALYSGTGSGHWIKKNVDRGSYIILEDGSLWQIDRLDRIDASLWLQLSDITVTESTSGVPGYNYVLINTDDGETASAKYLGK